MKCVVHDYIYIYYILYSHDTRDHKIHIHDHVIDKMLSFNYFNDYQNLHWLWTVRIKELVTL